MDRIRIFSFGLQLACSGGSCGKVSLKRDKCYLHLKRLCALASVASYFQYNTENTNMAFYYPTAANTVQVTVQMYSDIVQLFVQ